MNSATIDISIIVLTFNHEKYIEKCISSILNQQHSLTIEIIIGDDGSSDKTIEILKTYALKENSIRVLFKGNDKEFFRNSKRTPGGNLLRCLKDTNGKFIALCDGDDYWTDTNKINKAINFINSDKNLVGYFHHVSSTVNTSPHQLGSKLYDLTTFLVDENRLQSSSALLFKNIFSKADYQDLEFLFRESYKVDDDLLLILLKKGTVYFDAKVMTYYRKHNSTLWSSNSLIDQVQSEIDHLKKCLIFFSENVLLLKVIKKKLEDTYLLGILITLKLRKYKMLPFFYKGAPINITSIKKIFKYFLKGLLFRH
ncbi:glycosyltransferase [Flammeovirga pectinis]|uniref:Glycosyltransferase n=1 Tax=Flammeovirga pectinis TaxID=2494373 RepID=A0A3S9P620_9BACT|nr:glycosyltransferase family 2 protein [Flammeovirga pectinis]AZQ63665.1 glycosyltransferase [Flammeovirga pectinis]